MKLYIRNVRILSEIKWVRDTCCSNQFFICQVNLGGTCETVASQRIVLRRAWRIVHLFLHVPAVLTGYIFSRKTCALKEREREKSERKRQKNSLLLRGRIASTVYFLRDTYAVYTKIQNMYYNAIKYFCNNEKEQSLGTIASAQVILTEYCQKYSECLDYSESFWAAKKQYFLLELR